MEEGIFFKAQITWNCLMFFLYVKVWIIQFRWFLLASISCFIANQSLQLPWMILEGSANFSGAVESSLIYGMDS